MTYKCRAILPLVMSICIARATVWYVHPDSTMNCIQDCLDSCSTGDTVLVGPGIYNENIVWPETQGIDLKSEYGPDSTIIHGYSNGRVIEMEGASIDTTTVIEGFTIRRGLAGAGAGMFICSCSPIIRNNVITDNDCYGFSTGGGGILCYSYAMPIIENNTISYNTSANDGGGIYCYSSSPTITGNTIEGNVADTMGAGIYCYQSSPYITNNTICYDSARGWGGGVTAINGSHPVITHNTISQNYAYNSGGGIYCYLNASPIITCNTVNENTCINNFGYNGAGMRISGNSNPTVKFCVFNLNYTTGITIYNSSPTFDSCSIAFNTHGIYYEGGGTPNVTMSNICSNGQYGIYNASNDTFAAEYNWWGDPSGPQGGVFGLVDYDPWLTDSVYWQIGITEGKITSPVIRNLHVAPNPFSKLTTVSFSIGQSAKSMVIQIYDATGRLVRDFSYAIPHAPCPMQISWEGDDNAGRKLPSGVYFVTLRAGEYSETKKVLLVR